MKRPLEELNSRIFDVVVVGGGIYGAAIAWEAASRGLTTALVEQNDFAAATSANSLKVIHGGFRYLQHGDLPKVRRSIKERQILTAIAPHLVHPLPVLVPTYGFGFRSKPALALALFINDVLGYDRNAVSDPQKQVPGGKTVSREECIGMLPGIDPKGVTGGAIFYDAQVFNSERLVLEFLFAARAVGAIIANYLEAESLLRRDGVISGVSCRDVLEDQRLDVRARIVVNAAGPWVQGLLDGGNSAPADFPLAAAFNVVTKQILQDYAVGVPGDNGYQDKDSLVSRRASTLFIAPWREHSLVGTTYRPFSGEPDAFSPSLHDVQNLVSAVNRAYPGAQLKYEDVRFVHAGLLPAREPGHPVQLASSNRMIECETQGLLSVVGVKYTTARREAVRVVDRVSKMLGKQIMPSISHKTLLPGGKIERFRDFLQNVQEENPCGLGKEAIQELVFTYGSGYTEVLRYMNGDGKSLEEERIRAQTRYAVSREMAQHLEDVVFRRTGWGSAGRPEGDVLSVAADEMASVLEWSDQRKREELEQVERVFSRGIPGN